MACGMSETRDAGMYLQALESLPTGVCLVDREGKIMVWNGRAERITGYKRQDVLGRPSREDFLCLADNENNELSGERGPLATTLRDGKANDALVSLRHKSGHRVLVRLRTVVIRDEHGHVACAAECFDESMSVAEWDRRQDKLAEHGCLDAASGTLNHELLYTYIRESLATFQEHGIPFSILCIEVNHEADLKARHGTAAVTAVLRTVGDTLEHSLRPGDALGRWNENEFLAVLQECSGEEAAKVGGRLRKMVEGTKIEWWGDRLPVTVSIGGAGAKAGDLVESMVERAEKALLASQAQGGMVVVIEA